MTARYGIDVAAIHIGCFLQWKRDGPPQPVAACRIGKPALGDSGARISQILQVGAQTAAGRISNAQLICGFRRNAAFAEVGLGFATPAQLRLVEIAGIAPLVQEFESTLTAFRPLPVAV